MHELHKRRGETEVHAHLLGVIAQDDLAVRHILEARELGIGRPAGNMTSGPVLVDGRFGIVRRLEEQLEPGFLQAILIPIDGLARILRPDVVQARVAVAVGVAHEVVAYLVLVDLAAGLLLQAAVERAQVVADAAADGGLLEADDLRALLSGRASGEQAGRAGAAHEDLGVDGLDDLVLGNLGLSAQPIVHCSGGRILLRGRGGRRAPRQAGPCQRGGRGSQTQKCATAQSLVRFRHDSPLPSCECGRSAETPRLERIQLYGSSTGKASRHPSEASHTGRVILPPAPS